MISKPIDVLNSPIFDFPLEDDIAAMVEAIRRSGGPTSHPTDSLVPALQAAEIFLHLSTKYHLERPLELNIDIRCLCRALARTMPDCAPLVNFANEMIKPIPNFFAHGEGERMRADMRARAERLRDEMFAHEQARIARAAQLIEPDARVVCHGFSIEFVGALRQAHSAGVRFSVNCLDGVRGEGAVLADELKRNGITANVISEGALVDATLVLVGAYGLGEPGLLNRTGTRSLAAWAVAHHVSFYSLCGTDKFFPAGYPPDLYAACPPELEWTRVQDLTGVITGESILTADQVRTELATHPVESLLLG